MRFTTGLLLALSLLPAQSPRDDLRTIASRAYEYAYPLVLMEVTRQNALERAALNQFLHVPKFPDSGFRQVIRPNADTLYSSAWLDLSKEPLMLRVPDTKDRYYLLQFMDAWTETFAAPGKRTTGTQEGWFAVVGPGWKGTLPARAQRIDSPTNIVWLLGRTQTNGVADYENVHAIQKGFVLMPLSLYPDGPRARAAQPPALQNGGVPPPMQVQKMPPLEFFRAFARALKMNPPHAGDTAMVRDLARIGIVPGKDFDASALDPDARRAIEEGARATADRLAKLDGRLGKTGPTHWAGGGGKVGRYGADYAARAAVARIGLGANPPEDATYMHNHEDGDGRPLSGANRYRMHFEKGRTPPVNAFWSVTVYTEDGYFAANPIDRYTIGDRDKLKLNADGSLDVYIQHADPGAERQSNWLPAPEGAFNLSLRMYWPKADVLAGRWIPPAVVRGQ